MITTSLTLSLSLLTSRYNNMANPDWGSVDWRLARVTPAHYEDGVYMMAETNRSGVTNLGGNLEL